MKSRAVVKHEGAWWYGWLIDIPGVNAQEHTKDELIKSLRLGALDMLSNEVEFEPDATGIVVDVPEPVWAGGEPARGRD